MREEQQLQKRLRARLAVCAYAYEFMSAALIPDSEYDRLSLEVDMSVSTDRPDLDRWFEENFDPSTGMWVRNHPDLERLRSIVLGILSIGNCKESSQEITES